MNGYRTMILVMVLRSYQGPSASISTTRCQLQDLLVGLGVEEPDAERLTR
jgi:hypothetical protein